MLTLAVVVILCLVIALLQGGSLESLAATNFRVPWLLFGSLAVQVAAVVAAPEWLEGTPGLAVILGTNLATGVFLWMNRKLAGTGLAALGLVLNVIVISANGAMPVNERSAEVAGIQRSVSDAGVKHEVMDEDTILPWLGDTVPIPRAGEVLSVGDVVLALGIGRLVYSRTRGASARGRHSIAA